MSRGKQENINYCRCFRDFQRLQFYPIPVGEDINVYSP